MDINTDAAIQALLAKGIKLPAQPKVLMELRRCFAQEDSRISDLARIISSDPGITSMLFKAARSPVFGRGKSLESVEQVLMVIGMKQTYNIVQAIALSSSIADGARKSLEVFWTRSQEVAQLAALIAAERVSACNIFPDQAYMAGVFHGCGVPILMQRFPDYGANLHVDTATCWPSILEEDKLYGVDHANIGYLVARHWGLPDFVCKAILYRHDVPLTEVGAVRSLIAMLQLASSFHHRITHTEDPLWARSRKEALAELGIDLTSEQSYFDEISEQFLA